MNVPERNHELIQDAVVFPRHHDAFLVFNMRRTEVRPMCYALKQCIHAKEFAMKVGLLLLAISSLLTASDKPPARQITNPQALAKVRSFCVDTKALSKFDRHLVKDFLKAESKPKHLLAKLPWKLVPECEEGASDAAAKVEFEFVHSG